MSRKGRRNVRKLDIASIKREVPQFSILELHYFGLKGYGLSDSGIHAGRPKFHLIGNDKLGSVVFIISEEDSPYRLENETILFQQEPLPFKINCFGRLDTKCRYFYCRGIEEWIPTLDQATILSVNFHPRCSGCHFCQRAFDKMPSENITEEEGFALVTKSVGNSLAHVSEITISTGLFASEREVVDHICAVASNAVRRGFTGRLFYIGCQLNSEKGVAEVLDMMYDLKLSFRYAYTVEIFSDRRKLMNNVKGDMNVEDLISGIQQLGSSGVEMLEYTYMPGLDDLDYFKLWATALAPFAMPHISIFRPIKSDHKRSLAAEDYLDSPVHYLCGMRLFYEKLYGKPIYGDQLGNLWLFPIDRINPILIEDHGIMFTEFGHIQSSAALG